MITTYETTNLFTQQVADESNYVVTILYNAIGTQDTYVANLSSSARFEIIENQPNFIPYDQLTNEICINWVLEQIGESGVASLQACLQGQIDSQINPPITPENTPLPF